MMDRDNITRTGAKDPWGREARASRTAARRGAARLGLRARPEGPQRKRAKGRCKPSSDAGMPGAGLTAEQPGKARSDRLALKPYRGKPPYGILGRAMETSASFEARSAPSPYPTEHRVGDRRVVRLIQKWLRAGVLEEGKR